MSDPNMRRIGAALDALDKARSIVDAGEFRAMAGDGPAGHCRGKLSDGEFDLLWAHVERARRLLGAAR